MIDMCKSVDPTFRIEANLAQHTIYHPACSCRGSNGARPQHIQRKGIVWLVAGSVGDGCAGLQPKFCGSLGTHLTLHTEGGHDWGNQRIVEAEMRHQRLGYTIFPEVPEHPFRKPTHRCVRHPAEPQGNIVAGEQHLIYFLIYFRFMLFHPSQFGGGEVSWRVQKVV